MEDKFPIAYIVVDDPYAPTTKEQQEKLEAFYDKIVVMTLGESRAKGIDLNELNVLVDEKVMEKVAHNRKIQKELKDVFGGKSKLRVVHKGKVSAHRKRNKNKKTHRK